MTSLTPENFAHRCRPHKGDQHPGYGCTGKAARRPRLLIEDGRVCISNNAAERALRCVPLGREAWLFCGSDRGGQDAAVLYTLIQTARLNDVDPQAWVADVLARIADHPISRLDELLPWNWLPSRSAIAA